MIPKSYNNSIIRSAWPLANLLSTKNHFFLNLRSRLDLHRPDHDRTGPKMGVILVASRTLRRPQWFGSSVQSSLSFSSSSSSFWFAFYENEGRIRRGRSRLEPSWRRSCQVQAKKAWTVLPMKNDSQLFPLYAVWPHVEIKSGQIFHKVAQNSSLYLKRAPNSPKSH